MTFSNKTFRKAALAVVALSWAVPAWAGDAKIGDIEIMHAWSRATPPKAANGGAYLSLYNKGAESDQLIGASTPVAASAELHAHMQDGDVMRMIALSSVDAAPGRPVHFEPGGLHVMLLGLKDGLKQGESFPLVLEFAKAGKVQVQVDVAALGAAAMPHDPSMHEQHMKDPAHQKMHEAVHGK